MCAGNQFSVPLIDFGKSGDTYELGWESVLRPPDRLHLADLHVGDELGISSPSP